MLGDFGLHFLRQKVVWEVKFSVDLSSETLFDYLLILTLLLLCVVSNSPLFTIAFVASPDTLNLILLIYSDSQSQLAS